MTGEKGFALGITFLLVAIMGVLVVTLPFFPFLPDDNYEPLGKRVELGIGIRCGSLKNTTELHDITVESSFSGSLDPEPVTYLRTENHRLKVSKAFKQGAPQEGAIVWTEDCGSVFSQRLCCGIRLVRAKIA